MTFELTCPGVLYAALVLGSGLLVVRLVLRSTRVHRPRLRALLLGLRATALAVVLLILANPVAHRENGRPPARQTNWLLLDTSASMEFGSAETRLAQARRLIAPVLEAPP